MTQEAFERGNLQAVIKTTIRAAPMQQRGCSMHGLLVRSTPRWLGFSPSIPAACDS